MQFRRSGQRDERRRRVLLDETLHPDPEEQNPASGQSGTVVRPRQYSEAARVGRQPPVTCLIPKRPWTLLILGLLGVAGIAAIQNLYTQVYLPAPTQHQSALSGLDLMARGSVASWYAALLLGLAAVTSVLIFALRRHRLDDYRGRYRAWLWVPAVLLLASLDATTGLHAVTATLLEEWAGPSFASPTTWQLGALWTIFGIAGLRVCWEIWASRLAVMSALAAACMYFLATLIELDLWLGDDALLSLTISSACQLLGHLAVAMTTVAYCRFVYLEAQSSSALPQTSRKTRRQKDSTKTHDPATKEAGGKSERQKKQRSVRVDAAHEDPAKRAVRVPEQEPEPLDEAVTEGSRPKQLSKAERRRLRKQTRKQASEA